MHTPRPPLAIGIALIRHGQKQKYERLYGSKVIHTQPEEEEKIASAKFRLEAKRIRNANLTGLGVSTAFTGIFMVTSRSSLGADWLPIITVYPAYLISTAYRFNKVANSEWAIVDEPTKEDALAHLKTKKKDPIPTVMPIPQGI